MTSSIIPPQCIGCAHFQGYGDVGGDEFLPGGFLPPLPAICDAYPDGIPEPIVTGEFDHTRPYFGDHGIQFETA